MIDNKNNELTQYVPSIEWKNDDKQKYIYEKLQFRLNWIESVFLEIVNNAYIKTANEESLKKMEKEFDIVASKSSTLDDRRSKLLSILRGQGVTNILKIKTIAESFENGEVEIVPHFEDYYYAIKFVGKKGIPNRLDDLYSSIEAVNPCHLGINYEFNYERWGELYGNTTSPYKWGELKKFTWSEVLNGKIYHNTDWYTKSDLVTEDGFNLVTEDGFGIELVEEELVSQEHQLFYRDKNNHLVKINFK